MEPKRKMMPIGPLMIEHRLIERMIRRIDAELERIERTREVDVLFIDRAVDFIRTYADRCHHGKEEDILFRELASKPLTPAQRKTMQELLEEHAFARNKVAQLVAARKRYESGDKSAADEIRAAMSVITDFYPKHIVKEDKGFFLPIMEHFNQTERDALLQRGFDFDAGLIHEKYKQVVEDMERDG